MRLDHFLSQLSSTKLITPDLRFCISFSSSSISKMQGQLLFMAAIIALQIQLKNVGEEASSKSRTKRFTFLNCFDISYGTAPCTVKGCVKLYFYHIRAVHVHKVRNEATEGALKEKLSKGLSLEEAVTRAYQKGNAAAIRESRQAKHMMGLVISCYIFWVLTYLKSFGLGVP
ncbi:hypothetical protein U1Q18_019943 [Sarracenia purpurea var. burkii]